MPQCLVKRACLTPRPWVGNHNQVQKEWQACRLFCSPPQDCPYVSPCWSPCRVSPKAPCKALPASQLKVLRSCLVAPVLTALPVVLFFLGAPAGNPYRWRARAFIRPFLWTSTIGTLTVSSHLLALFCRQLPKMMDLMSRRIRLQRTPAAPRIYPSGGGVAREHSWDQMVAFWVPEV